MMSDFVPALPVLLLLSIQYFPFGAFEQPVYNVIFHSIFLFFYYVTKRFQFFVLLCNP